MAQLPRKRKCLHCKTFYYPDHRNVTRQRFCSKLQCRQASKVDAQQRWRHKPDNLDYFKGEAHVERVRQWRLAHPGYWRRKAPETHETSDALQETLTPQAHENQPLEVFLPTGQRDRLTNPDLGFTLFADLLQSYSADNHLLLCGLSEFTTHEMS